MAILHDVTTKLTELGIPYMVGGSFASSLYGLARTTQDADLVVSLTQGQVPAFVEAFAGQFYLDSAMIENSLRHQTSFNIIHLESTFKIDFFPLRPGEFHQQSFTRRRLEPLDATLKVLAHVQSAEDTVLYKLD